MRVTIAAVGRDRSGPTRDLFDEYCRRCPWPVRLLEVSPRTAGPPERRLAEEAERLSSAVPRDAAFDRPRRERPRLTSRAFATQDRAWQRTGPRELAFLIGGPDGLDPALIAARAIWCWRSGA